MATTGVPHGYDAAHFGAIYGAASRDTTLLGSHWKANTEPPDSWYRARGWRRLGCCMVTMLHIVQLFAELTIETEHTLTLPTLLGRY